MKMMKIDTNKSAKRMSSQNEKKFLLKKGNNSPNTSEDEDDEDEYITTSDTDDVDSDSSYKPPIKSKNKKKKVIESEDNSTVDEDEELDENDEDETNGDVNNSKLYKLLYNMFPSKYMKEKCDSVDKEDESVTSIKGWKQEKEGNKKVKSESKTKSSKQSKSSNTKSETKSQSSIKTKTETKPQSSKSEQRQTRAKTDSLKKTTKKNSDNDDSDDEDDKEYNIDELDTDTDDDSDEDYIDEDAKEDKVYNILFTIGNENDYLEEDEDEEYYEESDEECNSEDEKKFMKETYETVVIPENIVDVIPNNSIKKDSKKKKEEPKDENVKKDAETETETEIKNVDVEKEYLELVDTKKQLVEQLSKKPSSKILRNAIDECEKSIKKLIQKSRSRNTKSYHKLVNVGKKYVNEYDYFKKNLSHKQQTRVMNDLTEINKHLHNEKPYRLSLLDSNIPSKYKATALHKINMLRSMEPGDNEYHKIKNWVDTFMRIPFGIYKNLSITMSDGIDVCHDFMDNAMQTLDKCVYGLNDAKLQIMQLIGQWIANPSSVGSAIAIHGPPGTGKTSLVKEGISKILGREFAFIALGGTGDSSFLEGHSYTYEGSSWGKIVQILIESKCMNPVIYFDELDKISETPRGEEIAGILTHLTDTSQNTQFHDKYFSEVEFDISKCLFIFSYNDESKVNPILKDRMYRIQTKGYENKEKLIIARNYLLPKIREQVNFNETDVIIPDDTIQYILSNIDNTKKESGVRNLKRCLEIIYTKLNLFRLVKPDTNIFGKDMSLQVEFPFTVTKQHVDMFIKKDEVLNQSMLAMYC